MITLNSELEIKSGTKITGDEWSPYFRGELFFLT